MFVEAMVGDQVADARRTQCSGPPEGDPTPSKRSSLSWWPATGPGPRPRLARICWGGSPDGWGLSGVLAGVGGYDVAVDAVALNATAWRAVHQVDDT